MFGTLTLEECLDLLRKTGVSSIELNNLHMGPPITQIELAIENILKNEFLDWEICENKCERQETGYV